MSGRIALGLLRHYAEHEAEILERLTRAHLRDYMRLIGRMLPQDPAEGELEPAPSGDTARAVRAVRAALERARAGQGTLADVEAALAGLDEGHDP